MRFHIDYDSSSSSDDDEVEKKKGAQIGFNYNKKVEKFSLEKTGFAEEFKNLNDVKLPDSMEFHETVVETAGFINSQEKEVNVESLEIILQTKNREFTFLSKNDDFYIYYQKIREILKKRQGKSENITKTDDNKKSESSGSESEIPEHILESKNKIKQPALDENSLLGKLVAKKRRENELKTNIWMIRQIWSDSEYFLDRTITPPPPDLQVNMNEWAERLVDYFVMWKKEGEEIHEYAIKLGEKDYQVWGHLIEFMCSKNEFLEYFHFRVKKEMDKKMPVEKVEVVKKWNRLKNKIAFINRRKG